MAKTFLVTDSMSAARDWCHDTGHNIREVEVITRPEDTYGTWVAAEDTIVYAARVPNRHTNRAVEMLKAYQAVNARSKPTP